MSKITKQLAICAALRQRNFKPRPDKDTRKYVVFESPRGSLYWVGRMGAVRVGPSVSKTSSLLESAIERLATEGGFKPQPKPAPVNPIETTATCIRRQQ